MYELKHIWKFVLQVLFTIKGIDSISNIPPTQQHIKYFPQGKHPYYWRLPQSVMLQKRPILSKSKPTFKLEFISIH